MTTEVNPRWDMIPSHMHGAVSRYLEHGIPGGSFLTAVFSGAPLTEVVGRADDENQRSLVGWAQFLYNEVPHSAHGSPEKVRAWCESGGFIGQRASAAKETAAS